MKTQSQIRIASLALLAVLCLDLAALPALAQGCSPPSGNGVPGAASMSIGNEVYALNHGLLSQYLDGKWTLIAAPYSGSWVCPPAAPLPDGSFFMVENLGKYGNLLLQYDPQKAVFTDYGGPPGMTIVTTPSEVMYGNRVYLIAQDNSSYGYYYLWEMKFGGGKGTWTNFGTSPFDLSLLPSTPSVLYDGSLFLIDLKGELINMWWDASAPQGHQWVFLNNGYCVPGKGIWPFDTPPVGALYVGAPIASSKVFVTCTDGTLRERWYNGSNGGSWNWNNHGKPAWYNHNGQLVNTWADTRPIALGNGNVFLNTATTNSASSPQILVQLWYDASSGVWVWAPEENPHVFLTGNVAGDPVYPPNVYSLGMDGNIWDAQYDPSTNTFNWINLY